MTPKNREQQHYDEINLQYIKFNFIKIYNLKNKKYF